MTRTLIKAGVLKEKARTLAGVLGRGVTSGFAYSYRRIRAGRAICALAAGLASRVWLFAAELAAVALVTFGIAQWSVPAALIIGGLVAIAAIEVRPPKAKFPSLPPPEEVLRRQAESAAILINNNRYGLASVDADSLAKLTPAECEHVIMAARSLGVPT